MIKLKANSQVKVFLYPKQRQRVNALFSMFLALVMLVGVWGTTAVFAAPPVINDQTLSQVSEHSATGTSVGFVQATGAGTFAIIGGNGSVPGAFDIDENTGEITVFDGSQIDYESVPNQRFEIIVEVNNGETSSATITIPIFNTNDAPVIDEPFYSKDISEATEIHDSVLTIGADDPDGDDLIFSIMTPWIMPSAGGPFAIDADTGVITLEGPLDYELGQRTYVFIVKVSDGGKFSTTTITFNIEDANDAPVANDDSYPNYIVDEADLNVTITTPTILDNDEDEDGDNYNVDVGSVTQPSYGSVSVDLTGTFIYTPDGQFNGVDTFTYRIQDDGDGNLLSNIATVAITVTGSNDAPTAVDDTYTMQEEGVLTANGQDKNPDGVLANDTDPENNTLEAFIEEDVLSGALVLAKDGTFVYTPELNFAGDITFTYSITDIVSGGLTPAHSNIATVTITVQNENDPPTIADDTFDVDEDASDDDSVGTPISSDPDTDTPDGEVLTYRIVSGSDNAGDAFKIDPATGEILVKSGAAIDFETFTSYTLVVEVKDDDDEIDTATITINVNDVNEAPIANPDNYETDEDTTLTILPIDALSKGVLANDEDIDDAIANLLIDSNTAPSNGILSLAVDGSFIYTPTADFFGVATFTYIAKDDDNLTSNSATVTIMVNAVNDLPVANDDGPLPQLTTDEDTPFDIPFSLLTANDSPGPANESGQDLTAVNPSQPANGSITISGSNFRYTPNANFNGTDTFEYYVQDSGVEPNTSLLPATVIVTVDSVNDAPILNVATLSVKEVDTDISDGDDGSGIGKSVGTVTAEDTNDTPEDTPFEFGTMPGGDGYTRFGINAASGEITVIDTTGLDMEGSTQSFTLTVVVTDSANLTATAVFPIDLIDVNEFDPVIAPNQVFTITETAQPNDLVNAAPITATDEDHQDVSSAFAITGGTGQSLFTIDNSGNIRVAAGASFDYEGGTNSYTLDISVTDNGDTPGTRTGSQTVQIDIADANEPPVLGSLAVDPTAVVEGGDLVNLTGTITDQDTGDTTHHVTVDWGDGSTTMWNNATDIDGSHQYKDDPSGSPDTYTIRVTVADRDDETALTDTDTIEVTVTNVDPVLSGVSITPSPINEGESATLSGTISDAGVEDTFSLQVTWGDGQVITYPYPVQPSGLPFTFDVNHIFEDDGQPLTVDLLLIDDDGGQHQYPGGVDITVNNVAPEVDAGKNQIVNVGETVSFTGVITDPGTADTHTKLWDFGDSATDNTNILTPEHTYTAIGVYTVNLTVTDDDGGVGSDTMTVTVVSPSDMKATKAVRGSFTEEGTVFYTITLINNGDSDQLDNAGDELTDMLPPQLALVDAQVISGGGTVTKVVATNTVTWNGAVASGSSVEIEIEAMILPDTKGAAVSNQATIAYDEDGNGSNEATTYSDDPAVAGSYDPTVFNVADEYLVFIPIVVKNYTSAPDLVVTNINASSDLIEVVIENQGNAPVTNSFWVDFYINPNPVPTAANDLWPESGPNPQGLAWGVTERLAVGASLTLSYSTASGAPNLYFVADESLYDGSMPAGTPVYAQADSARAGVGLGAVAELDELTGKPYNNILGGTAVPVSSTTP